MKPKIIERMRQLDDSLTAKTAEAAFETVTAALKDVIVATGQARIPEFGTFKTKDVPSRTVRNPQSGEQMQTQAHTKIVFKHAKGAI